ncbi:hypothetical protein KW797_04085 [Candidatus Parcubacteria bacterium]|nr:hypothetical protein [Candidatus Parcubacteria bacterium]
MPDSIRPPFTGSGDTTPSFEIDSYEEDGSTFYIQPVTIRAIIPGETKPRNVEEFPVQDREVRDLLLRVIELLEDLKEMF